MRQGGDGESRPASAFSFDICRLIAAAMGGAADTVKDETKERHRVGKRPGRKKRGLLCQKENFMERYVANPTISVPCKKGHLAGQKASLKLRKIWAIRIPLQLSDSVCKRSMFQRLPQSNMSIAFMLLRQNGPLCAFDCPYHRGVHFPADL